MKFGKGEFKDQYDFSLMRAPQLNDGFFIGMPQWVIKEWRGSVFKLQTPQASFLKEYSKTFDCVEVSSTFYTNVSEERLLKWRSFVSDRFKFLPKWPKLITHDYLLKNCDQNISDFIHRILKLEENLGSTILQLPPKFTRRFSRELYYFLLKLPRDFPISIEFRDKSWFENKRLYPKLEDYFYKNNISTVVSDLGGNRDVFHYSYMSHTIVRYLSDGNEEHDKARLQAWSQQINRVKYFIMHKEDNSETPELLKYIDSNRYESMMNQHLDLQSEIRF